MLEWKLLFWLTVVVGAYEKSTTSKCLWYKNSCVDVCPDWMVIFESDCNQTYWKGQRTCQNPEPTLLGTECGFSRCDCPEPMLLDSPTGYCYDVDNCPTTHSLN